MVDRYLRPWKARAYAPLVRALRGVPPDAVSAAGLAVGLAAAGAAASGRFGWALAAWLANRVLDGIDGELARARASAGPETRAGGGRWRARAGGGPGRPPLQGAYLDLMLDLIVYAALPLGIAAGVTGAFGTPPLASNAGAWPAAAAALAAFYLNLGSWALLAPALTAVETGSPASAPAKGTEPPRAAAPTPAGPSAAPTTAAPGLRMPSGLVEGAETVVAFALALAWPAAAPAVLWVLAAATAAGAVQRTAWGLRRLSSAEAHA